MTKARTAAAAAGLVIAAGAVFLLLAFGEDTPDAVAPIELEAPASTEQTTPLSSQPVAEPTTTTTTTQSADPTGSSGTTTTTTPASQSPELVGPATVSPSPSGNAGQPDDDPDDDGDDDDPDDDGDDDGDD